MMPSRGLDGMNFALVDPELKRGIANAEDLGRFPRGIEFFGNHLAQQGIVRLKEKVNQKHTVLGRPEAIGRPHDAFQYMQDIHGDTTAGLTRKSESDILVELDATLSWAHCAFLRPLNQCVLVQNTRQLAVCADQDI